MFNFLGKELEKEWKHQPLYPEDVDYFTQRLFKKIDFNFSGKNVLDVGCGWGTYSVFLSKLAESVVGIDIEPKETWAELMNTFSNLKFQVGDVCRIPFKKETFDAVFMKDSLHHVSESQLPKALSELERVTKSGGVIIIVEPQKYNPIFYLHFTLLRSHPHFSERYFRSLLCRRFSQVEFKNFDLHNYPTESKLIRSMFSVLEAIWERTPFLKRFTSYIVAMVRIA